MFSCNRLGRNTIPLCKMHVPPASREIHSLSLDVSNSNSVVEIVYVLKLRLVTVVDEFETKMTSDWSEISILLEDQDSDFLHDVPRL